MSSIIKHTESESKYHHIEKMSVSEILTSINNEDKTVPLAIEKSLPQIEKAVEVIVSKMKDGGRLFYIGAGTSGRLGIVDASELPPTFGADSSWVVGIIAGGDGAIRKAVEFAEDNEEGALQDLAAFDISDKDVLVGIAASGTTPYVVGGLNEARTKGITTVCIVCNENSPLEAAADYPIVVITGPEFVTGSTRMKAGTAQKLVLNMISTSVMIQLGRIEGNRMVDMQLSNNKLWKRGTEMIMAKTGASEKEALDLLKKHGSVRAANTAYKQGQI